MKRYILAGAIFMLLVFSAFGISKVAVLDATLGEGVHSNAAAIVADTINEQFVKADGFIAIDRTYISKIQAEKQFQLSGEVNEADIKELGVTFGAEYLCIANVSLLGRTYTVSARMIEVATAQVVSQESARMQGEIDVLFNIAEEVGSKLTGKNFASAVPETTTQSEPPKKEEPVVQQPPVTPVTPQPAPRPAKPTRTGASPHFSIGFMLPWYSGDDGNNTFSGDSYYSFYETDLYVIDNWVGVNDAWNVNWGLDIHMLRPIGNILYLSVGASYTSQSLHVEDTYYDEYIYDLFSTLDLTTGVGILKAMSSNLQVYGGFNIGLMVMTLSSGYSGYASSSYWSTDYQGTSAAGFLWGLEMGVDYFLGDILFGLRYKLSKSPDLTGDTIFTDDYQDLSGGDTSFGVNAIVLSLGYRW